MKSYTDIEQSKVLAKILPLESADYFWAVDVNIVITAPYITNVNGEKCVPAIDNAIPCWSLAALLNILSYPTIGEKSYGWLCTSFGTNKEGKAYLGGKAYNNPIDACYEMVLRLHELEML
jgi:hypothetical protein